MPHKLKPQSKVMVTGLSVLTPLADHPQTLLQKMLSGQSAIGRWKTEHDGRCISHIGGDLSDYPIKARLQEIQQELPDAMRIRLRRLCARVPHLLKLSLLMAVKAWHDTQIRGVEAPESHRTGVIAAGHNLNMNYIQENYLQYEENPAFMDRTFSLFYLDTIHVSAVTEMLQVHGPSYTVAAACASGSQALRTAYQEILSGHADRIYVLAPVYMPPPADLHAIGFLDAIVRDTPLGMEFKASCPFDISRQGFVPAHGGACLVLDRMDENQPHYGQICAATASVDGQHKPIPSLKGQEKVMRMALDDAGLEPEEIDFISAHATSTPKGDALEIEAIQQIFGHLEHPPPVNAAKSMLGHTLWSASALETTITLLQMEAGRIHPSAHIENQDPTCDWDVCREGARQKHIRFALKNAFGFGGYNTALILKRGNQ
ncbi:beta-ketoacyl-[acyl-carrier-protein] synthase family protein [Magnetococcales bacterium HHB-1]